MCASAKEHDLESAINALPEMQQIAVRGCFKAANKPANGRRHSLEWIYECLLMRIQNSKLYEHLRTRKILILPTRSTLEKYIQKVGTVYGFQESVFECLKLKASRMEIVKKHGILNYLNIAIR